MNSLVSQVLKGSQVLGTWNGYNNRLFITSNRLIKKLLETGVDSKINTPTFKQLFQYDYEAFITMMNKGIQVEYQGRQFTLETVGQFINMTSLHLNSGVFDFEGIHLNKTTVNKLADDYSLNKDITDVLRGLLAKGL